MPPPAIATRRFSVLLIGNYRTTLAVMRSLAKDGFRVILGTHGNTHGNERSHHCAETWPHPALDAGGDEFGRALDALLARRPDIELIFPVTEEAVVYFARHPDAVADDVALVSVRSDIVELCQDKERTLALAAAAGVQSATHAVAADFAQLLRSATDVGYPCVVRPLIAPGRLFGHKAIVARSVYELQAALPCWPAGHARLLIQRYVDGPRHNVYFFAREGQVEQCVQVQVLRTDRADGTGLAVEGVSVALDPRLEKATRQLALALEYSGVGCAQFLIEATTGKPGFLEINPRLGANCAAVSRCGIDLPLHAARLAAGLPLPVTSGSYSVGVRYAWVFGDLAGLQHELAAGSIGWRQLLRWLARTAAATLRADTHLTFAWRDPRPALTNYWNKLRTLSGSAFRRVRRLGTSSHA